MGAAGTVGHKTWVSASSWSVCRIDGAGRRRGGLPGRFRPEALPLAPHGAALGGTAAMGGAQVVEVGGEDGLQVVKRRV